VEKLGVKFAEFMHLLHDRVQ